MLSLININAVDQTCTWKGDRSDRRAYHSQETSKSAFMKYNDMVNQWGEEKEKLENQMDKLAKQLENIKGRTNRQSRSSRDKMSLLANEKQRSTVGDYKLETIQEIHDEVADLELKSNLMTEDRKLSFRDISPRGSIDLDLRIKSKDETILCTHFGLDNEPPLNLISRDKRFERSEMFDNHIGRLKTVASEQEFVDRSRRADETLNCIFKLFSG